MIDILDSYKVVVTKNTCMVDKKGKKKYIQRKITMVMVSVLFTMVEFAESIPPN